MSVEDVLDRQKVDVEHLDFVDSQSSIFCCCGEQMEEESLKALLYVMMVLSVDLELI